MRQLGVGGAVGEAHLDGSDRELEALGDLVLDGAEADVAALGEKGVADGPTRI